MTRAEQALAAAREDARRPYQGGPRRSASRTRRVAIGDPQAPAPQFFAILEYSGLLGPDGRLRPEVGLVSIGDHFDWGTADERAEAARDGLAILAWLAAHPADQVMLLAGNHDFARVGELAAIEDDAGFARMQVEADQVYGAPGRPGEPGFALRHPFLPDSEAVARDFATFRVDQRALVTALLRSGRFALAAAAGDLLLTHAGITKEELSLIGLSPGAAAAVVADALNAALDRAVAAWKDGARFTIPSLHHPGSAATGFGRGMLFHRPADPSLAPVAADFAGPPRRKFDPRALPAGLRQASGHIRDGKCRELLGAWAAPEPTRDGPLRHLVADASGRVRYARGLPRDPEPEAATLVFLDGGMRWARPEEYELLEL